MTAATITTRTKPPRAADAKSLCLRNLSCSETKMRFTTDLPSNLLVDVKVSEWCCGRTPPPTLEHRPTYIRPNTNPWSSEHSEKFGTGSLSKPGLSLECGGLAPLWPAATCHNFADWTRCRDAASNCHRPKRCQATALQREARFLKVNQYRKFGHKECMR